ncbi:hypothetical protein GC722_13035 [Auraticoccus sp. F435]|uniref:Pilus assembly protein TadE n=1 Tax=Auraticoccus cholistanensis TaxID=2656650 RepID=A0A6A9V1D8_9ACTN|nr:hypothetical protein [Auraticoccus cholistanensis]MVA76940.1 hypothetical protein [Auraticoccus cholistanensis]
MVTAELAVGVLASVVLTVLLAGTLGLVGVELTNRAVASEVAELVARGDRDAAEQVRRRAGGPVRVTVETSPGGVVVTASCTVDPVGRLGPEVTLSSVARVSWQPGEAP